MELSPLVRVARARIQCVAELGQHVAKALEPLRDEARRARWTSPAFSARPQVKGRPTRADIMDAVEAMDIVDFFDDLE